MALYFPPSKNAIQKTLGAQLLASATTVTLNNADDIQNKPGIFVVDRVDSNGVETPAKREYISFTGTSSETLTGLTRNVDSSGTDQAHAIGAIVEFIPDVIWAESINTALGNVVNTTTLALDTTKVADLSTSQTLIHKTLSAPNIVVGSDVGGDMYYRGAGASLLRLGLGTSGQVLTVTASTPTWETPTASKTDWINITDASVMSLDYNLGTKFKVTVVPDGSRTFFPTNATVSQIAMLRVQYASTASLALNLYTVNATVSWPDNTLPTPTATVGKADLFGFSCISTLPKFDGVIMGKNI